ncbi:hypothetical protein PE36_00170 [Moritella sp. PE36]|uniref:hypothetical protein n=1 Tax=Moritella sp. PE36 TaxID=58051 RepID=UPI0001569283|nr:hypothetical protein [Moritella sp. PE36]EDM66165.1 hypothetical protein PE36_00170 [Moritella sp. PE36]
MGFEDELDLFAYWLLNDKCISSREASGLNQGDQIQSGENKGERKKGTCGLFLSDRLDFIYQVYENEISKGQRQVFDIEYGLTRQTFRSQIERAEHINISIMAYKKRLYLCRIVFKNQLTK